MRYPTHTWFLQVRAAAAKANAKREHASEDAKIAAMRAREADIDDRRRQVRASMEEEAANKKAGFIKETTRHDAALKNRDFRLPYAAAVTADSVEKAR